MATSVTLQPAGLRRAPSFDTLRTRASAITSTSGPTAGTRLNRAPSFDRLSSRGRRREPEPAAALQSSSPSSFGGLVVPSWHRSRFVSERNCALSPQVIALQQCVHTNGILPVDVEMLETYEVEGKVRDYEVDHYGVVNNEIYALYCQHAMHQLLVNIGFDLDTLALSGRSMVLAQMSMKYILPLRSDDSYVVSARVTGTSADQLFFEDFIYKLPNREPVNSAKATVVFLDDNCKPARIPHDVRAKLLKYKVRSKSTNSILDTSYGQQSAGMSLYMTNITEYILPK